MIQAGWPRWVSVAAPGGGRPEIPGRAEGRVPDMVESWRLAQPLPVTAVWEHDPAWSAVRPFR